MKNRQESDTAAMVSNITAEWRIGEVILDTYLVKQVHEGGSLSDWIRCRRLYEGGPRAALKRILDIAIQMA